LAWRGKNLATVAGLEGKRKSRGGKLGWLNSEGLWEPACRSLRKIECQHLGGALQKEMQGARCAQQA